jgi:hypothetical protein
MQHFITALIAKAMTKAKVCAWLGENDTGWKDNLNGCWIVASDSGGGAPFALALRALPAVTRRV